MPCKFKSLTIAKVSTWVVRIKSFGEMGHPWRIHLDILKLGVISDPRDTELVISE